MVPPSVKNPRKRTWDHEKDLYDFLLNKIRDPNTQKEKLNDLLHKFYINDPKADSDLIKFTDGPSSIIQSHLLHLQEQNSDSNNNDDEENLTEYEEERNRFLLNHLKRDGKSYVLEIVEDDVYVKFGDESSCSKKKGKLGVKKSKRGKRLSRVTSRKGGRGWKMKGAIKLSAAKKRGINNKKSDVASKAHKSAGKRKRGRPSKILEKNDVNEEGVSAVKSAYIDESVKKEIQDDGGYGFLQKKDDGGDDDVIHIITVESSDHEVNPRKVTEFREKLMKEINRPYCEEEHKKLSRVINARTPVQKYRDLRGSSKAYKGDHDGKSFLDHHLDLLKELEAARDDFPKVLRLLRGFFFWLKYSTQDGAFMPWRDPSCLDELPHQ